jgi:tetraacyldisaccharide 4'-kinase
VPHPFPDHHPFRPADLPDGTVVMTEKDAVKCAAWAPEDTWALRIDARLDEGLKSRVIDMLRKHHGQQAA